MIEILFNIIVKFHPFLYHYFKSIHNDPLRNKYKQLNFKKRKIEKERERFCVWESERFWKRDSERERERERERLHYRVYNHYNQLIAKSRERQCEAIVNNWIETWGKCDNHLYSLDMIDSAIFSSHRWVGFVSTIHSCRNEFIFIFYRRIWSFYHLIKIMNSHFNSPPINKIIPRYIHTIYIERGVSSRCNG